MVADCELIEHWPFSQDSLGAYIYYFRRHGFGESHILQKSLKLSTAL